ncbi:MAG: hypothetical protein K0B10_14850 [Vicingaceae bacterium]|nr:hypothetical protein [Vicingaceae bacterium]
MLTIVFASTDLFACAQSNDSEYSDYNYLSLEIKLAIKDDIVETLRLRVQEHQEAV